MIVLFIFCIIIIIGDQNMKNVIEKCNTSGCRGSNEPGGLHGLSYVPTF